MSDHNFEPNPIATLVVCLANVCRSATAGFGLSQFGSLKVQSAGISAVDGTSICSMAAHRLSTLSGGSQYVEDFASRSIDTVDPRDFELILTATSSIRGALVQRYPDLRNRAFTLVESSQLAKGTLSAVESSMLSEYGVSEILLRRRGTLPTLAPKRRWFRGAGPSPLDLVDTHGGRRRAKHEETINHALRVGTEIGQSLTRWRAALDR